MKQHLTIIGAVLRKDALSLWPFAALVIALQLLRIFDTDFAMRFVPGLFRQYLPVVHSFSFGFLVLAVFHEDATASLRHDWLTRPIPRLDLLAAKAVFLLLILLPGLIGDTAANWANGYSLLDSIGVATTLERALLVGAVLALIAVAALTSSLLEAAGAIFGVFALAIVALPLAARLSGLGEEVYFLGSGWVLLQPTCYFALTALVVVIWIQYAKRRTVLARYTFVLCAVTVLGSSAFLSWPGIFAVQKAVASDPKASDALAVTLPQACLPTALVNPITTTADELLAANAHANAVNPHIGINAAVFDAERRNMAGPNAVAFATPAVLTGVPAGWKVMISRVAATYESSTNVTLQSLRPARFTPAWTQGLDDALVANHFWLLSREKYEGLRSQQVHLSLNYSLNLLQPQPSELSIDGVRQNFSELGSCRASRDGLTREVTIDCFKRGPQPALITAELIGVPQRNVPDDLPDYTPSWLEFFGGKHYRFTLRQPAGSNTSRVKITAYEARAHVDRAATVPGVLGGSTDACPAPSSL